VFLKGERNKTIQPTITNGKPQTLSRPMGLLTKPPTIQTLPWATRRVCSEMISPSQAEKKPVRAGYSPLKLQQSTNSTVHVSNEHPLGNTQRVNK